MDFIVLIIAILVLMFAALRGYRLGIIKMVLYVIVLIFTIILTGILLKPTSLLIKENTSLYDNIEISVQKIVDEHEITGFETLDTLPFPEYILNNIPNASSVADSAKTLIISGIAEQIFNALVYVCLNIIIYVILRIVIGMFGIVARLPILKQLNQMAGFALGFCEGIVFLWLLCLLLQAFGSETWAQQIFIQINENELLTWIYNHNMVANFLNHLI